jgi:DNA-binding transcriptional LysR family regulator
MVQEAPLDELTQLRTFVKAVEAGSFSAAARDTSSISSVARQVKALEESLGARLLNRNSRRLSLTEAGQRLYERSRSIVDDVDSLMSEIRSIQEGVSGTLRVSLRISAGMTTVIPALPRLIEKYPDLELDIILTDERRNLIANQIDIALWLGELPDSELIARRLTQSPRILCGSKAYFAKFGVPKSPDDLRNHQCLRFTAPSYGNKWRFRKGDEYKEIEVHGSVRADSGLVLLSSALSDLGLIIAPEYTVRKHLAEGELIRVMSEYVVSPHRDQPDLYAVYPSSRGLSRKVRVFIDFLIEVFEEAG